MIPDIMLAYEGHIDELKTIHGTSETSKSSKKLNTAEDFKAAFSGKGIKNK